MTTKIFINAPTSAELLGISLRQFRRKYVDSAPPRVRVLEFSNGSRHTKQMFLRKEIESLIQIDSGPVRDRQSAVKAHEDRRARIGR